MKKILLLPIAIILTILLSAITVVFAVEDQGNHQTIFDENGDVTGDGKDDVITIKGSPLEEGTLFFKKILLKVKTSEGKTHKIKLESGYEPKIKLSDLNHDGVKDLFISVKADGEEGLSNFYLYSFKDGKRENIPLPESLTVSTQFQDGYRAFMKIADTDESFTFDLKDRKAKYEKLGLYNEGKLNEPMELIVSPYRRLNPVKLKGGKVGIKGVQEFSGIMNNDSIGQVESIWLYDKGTWKLTKTSVQENSSSKEKAGTK